MNTRAFLLTILSAALALALTWLVAADEAPAIPTPTDPQVAGNDPSRDANLEVGRRTREAAAGNASPSAGSAWADTSVYTSYLPMISRPACQGGPGLYGVVFHDLNGNGIRDQAYRLGSLDDHPDGWLGAPGPTLEPAVAGAVIRAGQHAVTTTDQGTYELCLPVGSYDVSIEASPYRYLLESPEEIEELPATLGVDVGGSTALDVGLGVGFLTLPYRLGDREMFRQGSYVDIDPDLDEVGVYNSYPEVCDWWHCTGDGHRGIDYYAPEGSLAVAAAPGLVYSVGRADDGSMMVVVAHTEYEALRPWPDDRIHWADRGFQTSYQHLASAADGIVPGAFVCRGQPIGYLNDDVHLHFDAQRFLEAGEWESGGWVDPYRDLFHDQFVFKEHWDRGGYTINISQGSPGYWTADNAPHFGQDGQ